MYYRVYTKTLTVKLPVIFTCESCEQCNVIEHPFSVSSSYDDRLAITNKGLQNRDTKATADLFKQVANLQDKISRKIEHRDVKNLAFSCVCPRCGTVPKWADFRNNTFDTVCAITTVIALIGAGLMYTNETNASSFLLPLCLFGIPQLARFILYSLKKSKVKKMDEKHLPIVCKNQEHLLLTMTQYGLDARPEKQPRYTPNHRHGSSWRCPGCGKMKTQTPCEHCGRE